MLAFHLLEISVRPKSTISEKGQHLVHTDVNINALYRTAINIVLKPQSNRYFWKWFRIVKVIFLALEFSHVAEKKRERKEEK
jgi:hypothetical protein